MSGSLCRSQPVCFSHFALLSPASSHLSTAFLTLPSDKLIQTAQESSGLIRVLDESNRLWRTEGGGNEDEGEGMREEMRLGREEVVGLACNGEVVLAWTRDGRVLGWGEDRQGVGVMGMGEVSKCDQPTPLPSLSHITSVSLSASHAAAIDGNFHSDLGRLFTWGTGPYGQLGTSPISDQRFKPGSVESARIFKAKEVACGENFTAVCTTGGYVYVYGVMGRHIHGPNRSSNLLHRLHSNQSLSLRGLSVPRSKGHENRPYTFPDGPNYFMTKIAAGKDLLAVLSEEGRAMVVDECMEIVRMEAGEALEGIRIVGKGVLGVGLERLYEWKEPTMPANHSLVLHTLISEGKSPCSLRLWTTQAYAIDPAAGQVQLVLNSSSSSEEILVKLENKGNWQWREISENRANFPQSLSKLLFQQVKSHQQMAVSRVIPLLSAPMRFAYLQLRCYRSADYLSLSIGPIRLISSLFRLRLSRISTAWGSLRTYQTIQQMTQNQAELETKQRKIAGLKRVMKALQGAVCRENKRETERLFSLFGDWRKWRKRAISALQIVKRYGNRYEERAKKRCLMQWNNWVIRCYISVKGVASLVSTLSRHLQTQFLKRLQHFSTNFQQKMQRLVHILRQYSHKSCQISLIRSLIHWKGLITGHKAAKTRHTEVLQAGIRTISLRLKGIIKQFGYKPSFHAIREYAERKNSSQSLKIRLYCLISVLNKVKFRVISGLWRGLKQGEALNRGKTVKEVMGKLRIRRIRWGMDAIRRNWMNRQIPRVFPLVLVLSKVQDRLLRLHSRLVFTPVKAVIHDFYPLTPIKQSINEGNTGLKEDKRQLGSLFVFDRWSSMGDKKEYYCPKEEKGYIYSWEKGDCCSEPVELCFEAPVPASPSASSSSSESRTQKASPYHSSITRLSLASSMLSLNSSPSSSNSRRMQYSQSLNRRKQQIAQQKTLKSRLFSGSSNEKRVGLIETVGKLYVERVRWGFEAVRTQERYGRERALTLVSQNSSGLSSPTLLLSASEDEIALERTWKARMQRVATERVRRTLVRREKRVGFVVLQSWGNRGK